MSRSETLQPEGQGPQDVVSIHEPSPLDELPHPPRSNQTLKHPRCTGK